MIPRTIDLRRRPACFSGACAVVLGSLAFGCESERSARPGWDGPLTVPDHLPNANLGASADSGISSLPCTAPVPSARPHEAGNYDNRSCNVHGCHDDMIGGGWIYTSPYGPPSVAGATVTINNIDGTTVKAYSGPGGFFQVKDRVVPPYKVCVSACPDTSCSLVSHPNADCQTSNCHGTASQRIYVSKKINPPTGGGNGGDAGACAPPVYGGPYTHSEYSFGQQPCSTGGCHCPPKPVFQGGYLYEGPSSIRTVAEATITLVPSSGAPITVTTGPDGMFFFGTVSAVSVAQALTAPYTACVSKCPLRVCSITNSHKTTEDCQTSNCHVSPLNVFLR